MLKQSFIVFSSIIIFLTRVDRHGTNHCIPRQKDVYYEIDIKQRESVLTHCHRNARRGVDDQGQYADLYEDVQQLIPVR